MKVLITYIKMLKTLKFEAVLLIFSIGHTWHKARAQLTRHGHMH